MLSVSSFMLAFSVSSIFAFNLKSFITILSHLSHVFISTLTCSSCLPMYPETLKPCLHIYSDILKSCLHINTDTLKALSISILTHSSHVFLHSDTFKSCLQSSSLPGHTQVTSSYLP